MTKRVIVSVVLIPVLLFILFGLPPLFLSIMIALLSMVAVHEILWSTGCVQHVGVSGISLALAGVVPFWVFYDGRPLPALFGLFIYVLILFLIAMQSKKTVTLEKMGSAFFVSLMIPFFLSSFLRIRQMEDGIFLLILPFVVAFLSDATALFAGMLFGKHKLAPQLSPKKTVEGAVGGLVGAVLGCFLYGLILSVAYDFTPKYGLLVIYGLLGSAVSQIGDLSFSYIKRQYDIKDYGNIFPGHGGVLDRFDSVIFCAPLVELLLRYIPAL